jgi:hypothetical protein
MKRVSFLFTILIFIVHPAFTQTLREKFRERKEQQRKTDPETSFPLHLIIVICITGLRIRANGITATVFLLS